MYKLYIANKNYSSWSLRPWVLMRVLDIPFAEILLRFDDMPAWNTYRTIAPNGKVPCLVDGALTIWDSLAIVEYLAETHPSVWPKEKTARAFARSACAEMHSGFFSLRNLCSMTIGQRVSLHHMPADLLADIARFDSLWRDGLDMFGGPYLAGQNFTAVDAFYAPVIFRVQSYGLSVSSPSQAYMAHMLSLPAMQAWEQAALAETFRDLPHEVEIARNGIITQDLRAPG